MAFDPVMLLRQVFPLMDEDILQAVARIARKATYPPDYVLCHEGAEEEVFYIVGEGQVKITQQLGSEERFLRSAGPGQYFGEMALMANTPRNATVRTTEQSSFLEIDKESFIEMIRLNPIVALTMFQTVIGWLRSNDRAAITALSAQKEELRRAYEKLQVQEKHRSDFLTTLAHELRTPLTTATGFMQLIKSGNMTGPALQMGLDKVGNGLERIVSLVNDLLFVQEMDLIAPTMRSIDLHAILREITQEFEERAARNHLDILVNIPSSLPEMEADPDGLTRALRAILDNAVKFSPRGGNIRIDVTPTDDYLDIAFTDPGIGIESDFLPRVFNRFEHQDRRGEFLFEGIGLGLAIAQHLIESLGGRILVESEVNQGSIFTVRLPLLTRSSVTSDAKTIAE
jgi:signal transduction histidine kinase